MEQTYSLDNKSDTLQTMVISLTSDNASTNGTSPVPQGEDHMPAMGLLMDDPPAYIVPMVFTIIFITGILGNGTLIFTVLRNKCMQNVPNILIVSLALGDLLLIGVSVPFTATIYTFTSWPYGEPMCKINEFLQTVSLGVSVYTLTALSGDRFMAIVFPMRMHRGSPKLRTILIAVGIWLLSVGLACLELVAAHTYENYGLVFCSVFPHHWGPVFYPRFQTMFRFIVYFTIPILIIAGFYSSMAWILWNSGRRMPGEAQRIMGGNRGPAAKQLEGRKKVAKLILSFIIVFVICWLPRHIFVLWFNYDPGAYNMFWHVFKIIGFCLCFINSCVNPMALYFLSNQFRKYFNKYLLCCFVSTVRGDGSEYSEASNLNQIKMTKNGISETGVTAESML